MVPGEWRDRSRTGIRPFWPYFRVCRGFAGLQLGSQRKEVTASAHVDDDYVVEPVSRHDSRPSHERWCTRSRRRSADRSVSRKCRGWSQGNRRDYADSTNGEPVALREVDGPTFESDARTIRSESSTGRGCDGLDWKEDERATLSAVWARSRGYAVDDFLHRD